jgi:mycothiol synthase
VAERLEFADRAKAAALIREVTEADGVAPLSEDGTLAVKLGRTGALHLVRRDGDSLVGYLYLGPADDSGGRTAELCVAPGLRRHGIGRMLVEAALAETVPTKTASGALSIWAHGSLDAARRFAEALGFTAVRELRLMESPLTGVGNEPPPDPDGVTIDTFQPGRDEEAWLALNARAFAHHPEQGGWTRRDLDEREAEPWFDPAGFFLARTADGPIGFHWTKVHPAGAYGPGPVGEVYVLGVDPAAAGHGLGRVLALAGLRHLAQSGLHTVVLYVDGDNTAAVRLYESLGFRDRIVDTLYERRGTG